MRAPGRPAVGVALVLGLLVTGCGREMEGGGFEEFDRLRVAGLAYLEEQQPEQAAARFERLARLAPREPLGPANLAVAELRRGNLEAARQAGAQAVERMPSDPDVRLIAAATSAEAGDRAAAEAHLQAALGHDSKHVRVLWALHELTRLADPLNRLLRHSPGNLPARLTAAEVGALADETDVALEHLEYVGQLLPPGDSEARRELLLARDAGSRGDAQATLRHVRVVHNLLRADHLYSKGLAHLTGRPGSRAEPLRRFRHVEPPPSAGRLGPLPVSFVRSASLDQGWTGGVATDVDGDGDEDLVVSNGVRVRCLRNGAGGLTGWDCASGDRVGRVPVQAADFDGDARADLLMVGPQGVGILYADSGGFAAGEQLPGHETEAFTALAADFDHDGDLDILVGGPGAARMYRQTSPGRFEEAGTASGLADRHDVLAASFGDLDLDGDLDLVLVTRDGVHRMDNVRHGTFETAGAVGALSGAPAIVDVTGDGRLDVVLGTFDGIFVAAGDGSGALGPLQRAADLSSLVSGRGEYPFVPRMVVEDFDLDGHPDVLIAPEQGGVHAFRGAGDGRLIASPDVMPPPGAGRPGPAGYPLAFDLDGDGDFDLASGAESGPALFRNEGGEKNHALVVSLVALADGSGKVNRLGIGSRIDVWAGSVRQSRVVRREMERFGLGESTRADVVRIEWTNGVPQNVFEPRASERLVERQVLKGSCAFLYVRTESGIEFVTDMMWKSALGMPLGIMAGEIAYAPPEPSLEYVRIPPGVLAERDGEYEIRITEELWEVAYLDRLELLAVDHPADIEVYANEAFGAPTVPNDRLHVVGRRWRPERAIDHRGIDVGPDLAERDFRFVGGFEAERFQGLTLLHDLTLRLEGAAGRPATLFLGGWIHPTDASIHVRIGQAGAPSVVRPYLEVPDGAGGWRRLDAAVDFPSGKNKTVVVELPDGLPVQDPRVRIRTNMEIYWDVAFYSTAPPEPDLAYHRLEPASAELRERGFSRMFRRGGRYGPHWFDYRQVREGSPWRPLPGAYTRVGDVRDLLLEPDDRYVVFGPGDEIAVRFTALPRPRARQTRTFFLYSDGFLKDADLNTRGGDRVGPLPRHGQATYPARAGLESAQGDIAAEYLTRRVEAKRPPIRPRRYP